MRKLENLELENSNGGGRWTNIACAFGMTVVAGALAAGTGGVGLAVIGAAGIGGFSIGGCAFGHMAW